MSRYAYSEAAQLPFTNPILIFLLVLLIGLISAVLMPKLKLPAITGFILAGILVGPHSLNLLVKDSGFNMLSSIGLLYIMFLAGVELDLSEFRMIRYKSIVFGSLTFSVPILIGFPVCYFAFGYSLTTSLLIASMFATHTLVAYPIVNKFSITGNEAVAITVGGTIITDTAVLILLPIITGAKNGGLSLSFWLHLVISVTVFGFVMFLIVPPVAKRMLLKLQGEKAEQYAFSMLVVLVSSILSQACSVEPIVGAFVAGIVLSRFISKTSPLINQFKFVGNSIFIPFFLVNIGMLIDPHVLFNGPSAMIIAITLTAVAITSKWIAAKITQKIFYYSSGQGRLIFGLSSSHAAATLAIIITGFKNKIIDLNVVNGTIILILVTCIVATLVTDRACLVMFQANTAIVKKSMKKNRSVLNQERAGIEPYST